MSNRITEKDLQGLTDTINKVTGHPVYPYDKSNGVPYHSIPGCYVLYFAYGGVNLHQFCNDGGGVSTPIGGGVCTKRELYYKMHAYLNGLRDAQIIKQGDK